MGFSRQLATAFEKEARPAMVEWASAGRWPGARGRNAVMGFI
jgi:hypothetical protein